MRITAAQARDIRRVLNEIRNAIPNELLPAEIRERTQELDELWERLSQATSNVVLTEDDAGLAVAAIEAAIRILDEDEFATRTGFEVSDARRLADDLQPTD